MVARSPQRITTACSCQSARLRSGHGCPSVGCAPPAADAGRYAGESLDMSRQFIVAALCWAFSSLGCASVQSANQPREAEPLPVIKSDRFSGVIVPGSTYVTDSWTPTNADVYKAEPKLQQCVVVSRKVASIDLPRLFRQYSGEMVAGRRVLSVQFFDLRFHKQKSLRHPVIVVDGTGDDHFTAGYDLDAERCISVDSSWVPAA